MPIVVVSERAALVRLRARLDDIGRRQLPFAAARALTATARQVARDASAEIGRVFDRPVPFTRRAVGITAARKERPVAAVFLKDVQARYLAPSILGRRQVARRRDILNPKQATLNALGNLPQGALARLKGRRDVFIGTVRGVYGVWRRPKRHAGALTLLIRLDTGITLRRRFEWAALVNASVARNFAPALDAALAQALATAR